MYYKKAKDGRKKNFELDKFINLITFMRRMEMSELTVDLLVERFGFNRTVANEILFLFDVDWRKKGYASIDYYEKFVGYDGKTRKTITSPKIYPSDDIGRVMKAITKMGKKVVSRNMVKVVSGLRSVKVTAVFYALIYIGQLRMLDNGNAEFAVLECYDNLAVRHFG